MSHLNFWLGVVNVACVGLNIRVNRSMFLAICCAVSAALCFATCTPPWVTP